MIKFSNRIEAFYSAQIDTKINTLRQFGEFRASPSLFSSLLSTKTHFFHQFLALWECRLDACLGRAPSGSLGRQIQFGFQLQKCQPSRKNGLQIPAWHFRLAGGAGLGGTRDQGSFLDIAKTVNPLAKNDGLEEQADQDGVLARTWTSQNVRMYRTKHALLKTWWNYVLSIAGFRGALVEASPRAA